MKKSIIIAALICVGLFSVTGAVFAADATLGLDMNSAYVWRGITFNDGMVIQPYLDVTKGGFNVNVWGNMDIDDYNDTMSSGEFSEVDLTMSYSKNIDKIDLSVGIIEYLFPNGGKGTTELYVSGSASLIEGLSAGLDFYYDIDEVDDYYSSVNIGYSHDFSEKLGLEASVSAGYAGKDMSAGSKDGFHDVNVSLSAGYSVTDNVGIGASINYTDSLDDDVLPEQDVDVYGGVSISCSF